MPEAVAKETGAEKMERERRECFDLFDKTNSGKIQRVEIGLALRALGYMLTDKDVQKIQDGLASSEINFKEFQDVATKNQSFADIDSNKLVQAFETFDPMGTGEIATTELRHVLTSIGEKMTEEEFDEVVRAANISSGGNVSYRELLKTMKI